MLAAVCSHVDSAPGKALPHFFRCLQSWEGGSKQEPAVLSAGEGGRIGGLLAAGPVGRGGGVHMWVDSQGGMGWHCPGVQLWDNPGGARSSVTPGYNLRVPQGCT